MKHTFKRTLSLLLSLLCLLSVFTVAASAAAPKYDVDYPVVYISGKFTYIYDKDFDPDFRVGDKYDDPQIVAHQLYPMNESIGDMVNNKDIRNKVVFAYNLSSVTGNWKYFADAIYDVVEPRYRELRLDGNGNITNGSHIQNIAKPATKLGGYTLAGYTFTYDSRLDPFENAERLHAYIQDVLRVTGKDKVNLIGRCLGTTIVSTYLTEYGNSQVESAIFYASAFNGVQVMDDFFTGNFKFDEKTIDNYINYQSEVNPEGNYDLNTGWNLAKMSGFLGLGINTANDVWKKTKPYLSARLARAVYGTWPGHWAMISADVYEAAKKNVFGDCMDEYAGLIKKIDRYHNEVMSVWPQTLKRLVEKEGLRIAIFAKYNTPLMPLGEGSKQQADGTVELETMSLGATSAPYGEYFTSEQIRAINDKTRGRYLSKDNRIDASTCLFPDYTWFLRDCPHNVYPPTINRLFMDIFHSKKQITVWDKLRGVEQFVSARQGINGDESWYVYNILGPNETADKLIEDTSDEDVGSFPADPVNDNVRRASQEKNAFERITNKIIDFVGKVMSLKIFSR